MTMRKKAISQQLQPKNELKCQHCGKDFKYESEKKRHEQSHSPQFACKVCNKKFSFMSALRRHEKQHERTGSVCCPHCNRKFRDESLLKRHIKYAHKGTFTCVKCNGIFNSDLALHSHMKTHKPESERKYRCSFECCNKTFNFRHHLKHHELTHTNTKQYFCSICEKGFIQYHHMKSHLKIHKPNSLLPCLFPGCERTFATDAALSKHSSIHKNADLTCAIQNAKITISANDKNEDTNESNPLSAADFNDAGIVLSDSSSQLDWREQYSELGNSFKDNNRASNDLFQTEDDELSMLQKVNSLEINEDLPISNCKSSLGECIMGEDANGNMKCACAQIQSKTISIEDTYEMIANKNKYCNSQKKSESRSSILKPVKIYNDCDGCGCMSDLFEGVNKENNSTDSFNVINDIVDYKPDGTIQIKEASDVVTNPTISADPSVRIANTSNASDNIPFNSCKAVLGTCIVSGNGNIDESCLCAKMVMDDQLMLDQEITEITPCPKTYYY